MYRHPFPGPGLGVRILGEVREDYAELLRQADHIYIEELRRYDYVVSLRAVETIDCMTAHWARLPYDFLDVCSRRIVNEGKGISCVVYDISGKPPATIEWE